MEKYLEQTSEDRFLLFPLPDLEVAVFGDVALAETIATRCLAIPIISTPYPLLSASTVKQHWTLSTVGITLQGGSHEAQAGHPGHMQPESMGYGL